MSLQTGTPNLYAEPSHELGRIAGTQQDTQVIAVFFGHYYIWVSRVLIINFDKY